MARSRRHADLLVSKANVSIRNGDAIRRLWEGVKIAIKKKKRDSANKVTKSSLAGTRQPLLLKIERPTSSTRFILFFYERNGRIPRNPRYT